MGKLGEALEDIVRMVKSGDMKQFKAVIRYDDNQSHNVEVTITRRIEK